MKNPTATPTNGGKWYAFPSLAVNKFGDVLVGFSEFSSAQFASAGYALRAGDDPAGATRAPHTHKAGGGLLRTAARRSTSRTPTGAARLTNRAAYDGNPA